MNCFLDEASDRTNMTEDLTEQLGVQGQKKQIVVNVANDQQVKFRVNAFDRKTNQTIKTKTS